MWSNLNETYFLLLQTSAASLTPVQLVSRLKSIADNPYQDWRINKPVSFFLTIDWKFSNKQSPFQIIIKVDFYPGTGGFPHRYFVLARRTSVRLLVVRFVWCSSRQARRIRFWGDYVLPFSSDVNVLWWDFLWIYCILIVWITIWFCFRFF